MPTKRQRRKRRRRQEGGAAAAPPRAAAPPSARDLPASASTAAHPGRRASGSPKALWGSFPLSELVVLIALILLVAGFFVGGHRGGVMMIVGLALGALAGIELAAREHFAGYRSHNMLLAAAAGLAIFGLLFALTPLSPAGCAAAGAAVFVGSAWVLVQAFRVRSGGALYRIKGN
jgi:hypothetical protein